MMRPCAGSAIFHDTRVQHSRMRGSQLYHRCVRPRRPQFTSPAKGGANSATLRASQRGRRPDDDNGASGLPDDASVPLGDEQVVQIRALAEARPDADLARRDKHPRHAAGMLQDRNRRATRHQARNNLPDRNTSGVLAGSHAHFPQLPAAVGANVKHG